MLLNPRIIIDRVTKKVLSYVSYKKKKKDAEIGKRNIISFTQIAYSYFDE